MLTPLRINQHAAWKRDFPDYEADFLEIFGTVTPTITAASEWKTNWESNTSYIMEIPTGANIMSLKAVTGKMGIHPYYWGIHYSNRLGGHTRSGVIHTHIQFYSEELLVMFKLTWANE
jgi:hypothetical protein